MAIVNNSIIGLSDFHYALLTADPAGGTPTWGTIYSVPNVLRKASWNPNTSSAYLFADDEVQNVAETIGEMKLSINFADLPPEHQARMLGHSYASGQIVEKAGDTSPYLAVGFKALRSDGSYSYFWYYKGKFTKPALDHTTKEQSIKYQEMTLELAITTLFADKSYRIHARSDDTNFTGSATWWNAVVRSTSDLTALSVVIAKSGLNTTFTFAKVSGLSSFNMDSLFINNKYLVVIADADQSLVAGVYTAVGKVVTFVPTTPFGTGKFRFIASGAVRDEFGIELATSVCTDLTY